MGGFILGFLFCLGTFAGVAYYLEEELRKMIERRVDKEIISYLAKYNPVLEKHTAE